MALDQRKQNWLCLVAIFISMALIRAEKSQVENHDVLEERELTLEKRSLSFDYYQKGPGRTFKSVIGMKKPSVSLTNATNIVYIGGCKNRPRMPKNSKLYCGIFSGCVARCLIRNQFPNGETKLYLRCKDGKWAMANEDWESIPDCEPICLPPCRHNGICVFPNVCNCSEGFSGPQCQYQTKPCLNLPPLPENSRRACRSKSCTILCDTGFEFPGGSSVANMICREGNWVPSRSDWKLIPNCQSICQPRCQNNGICVLPNVCNCSEGFSGPQCQYQKKPCLNLPPLPENSRRSCGSKSCTIVCATGFVFPGGYSVANMVCRDGNWVPTRSDWKSIPNCQPIA